MIFQFTNSDLSKTFRYLHSIPETEWNEVKTSAYIKKKLLEFGMNPIECTKTGVYADIIGGKGEGKMILLRADIDALPIKEESGVEYASKNDGVMHACGHDFHTTCLLYAAKALFDNRDRLKGKVRVLFQPAEEGDGGAEPMIKEGAMGEADAAFAIHADPLESVGTISYRDGGITASPDDYRVVIKGRGGHGANPEKCINPITVAAKIISRYNKIKETYFPDTPCVTTVCTVNSGTLNNIIPDTAEITGTARSFDEVTREKLRKYLEYYAEKTAKEYGAEAEFTYNALFPPCVNDAEMNKTAINAAVKTEGITEIKELKDGLMIGDDFSYFARLVPSSYIRFGTAGKGEKYPLHSSKFKVDEKALIIGCRFFVNVAVEYLKNN